jgi:hypothetical protein
VNGNVLGESEPECNCDCLIFHHHQNKRPPHNTRKEYAMDGRCYKQETDKKYVIQAILKPLSHN